MRRRNLEVVTLIDISKTKKLLRGSLIPTNFITLFWSIEMGLTSTYKPAPFKEVLVPF